MKLLLYAGYGNLTLKLIHNFYRQIIFLLGANFERGSVSLLLGGSRENYIAIQTFVRSTNKREIKKENKQ